MPAMAFGTSDLRSTEAKESESFTEEQVLRHDQGEKKETENEPYITRIASCSFVAVGNRVTLL